MSAYGTAIGGETARELPRPALRGFIHIAALGVAIVGAAVLLMLADSPAGYVGGAVFATSLILLYASSVSYHRVFWNTGLRRVVKRIDHAMIFVLIAGTYTAFCLDVSLAWGIPMLAVVWSLAGLGILFKVVWPDTPSWLSVAMYVGLGWVALAGAPEVLSHYSVAALSMLLLGGALYTIGGLVYATRRPDPSPRWFGYHEVFHGFVVAGSAVHYALIVAVVI